MIAVFALCHVQADKTEQFADVLAVELEINMVDYL